VRIVCKIAFKETSDDFHARVAKTLDEACKLIDAGFGKTDEIDGAHIYWKRK